MVHFAQHGQRTRCQSKRANLLLAAGLSSRGYNAIAVHPGYSRTNLFESNWSFLPDFLSFIKVWAKENPVLSMSPRGGAMVILRALLDSTVPSGSYITPVLWAVGPPVVSKPDGKGGPLLDGYGTWFGLGKPFTYDDVEILFEFSSKVSGAVIKSR